MRWLAGHKGEVRAVTFTPGGLLASGGADRTVRLWEPGAWTVRETIFATRVVYALAASPDGETLAFAGRPPVYSGGNNTVGRWGLSASKLAEPWTWPMGASPRSIWSLSFSADGRYLAAAFRRLGAGGHVNGAGGCWWRLDGPRDEGRLDDDSVYALRFAPQGERLALTRRGKVAVLERPGGAEVAHFASRSDWSGAVVFGGDGVAFGAASFLHFASLEGGKSRRLKTGLRTVTALAVSPDGRTLLAGGKPGTVEAYDIETRKRQAVYDWEVGGVHGLAVAPDGCTFAVAGEKGLIVCDVG